MELIQITNEMIKVNDRLNRAIIELNKLAKSKAESERDYRMALAKEYLRLKSEGTSVTLIPDLAKGKIADLLFERDASDAQFTAVRESISAIQTQASLLQSILKYQEGV